MTQTMAGLRFLPILPGWVLAALALLCVGAVALGLWRRARGSLWRAAAFAVLLFWLAGPTLVRETRQGLSDIALLIQDRSASMQTGDRTALAARAVHDLTAQAGRLPGLELRTVALPPGGHDGTQLWAALNRVLADIPAGRLSGILAVTDGQVHDTGAAPQGAPLHALITGHEGERDRRVEPGPGQGHDRQGHRRRHPGRSLRPVRRPRGPTSRPR